MPEDTFSHGASHLIYTINAIRNMQKMDRTLDYIGVLREKVRSSNRNGADLDHSYSPIRAKSHHATFCRINDCVNGKQSLIG